MKRLTKKFVENNVFTDTNKNGVIVMIDKDACRRNKDTAQIVAQKYANRVKHTGPIEKIKDTFLYYHYILKNKSNE